MKRGLPQTSASPGREARIRRATASPRVKSAGGRASAPWWHQPLLWIVLLASMFLINVNGGDDAERHFDLTRSIVVDHALPAELSGGGRAELSGVSLLWSPFMLAANAGVSIARSRGSLIAADGRSWPYLWAAAAGTAVYACLALWTSYRIALRVAKPAAAFVATLAIWLATAIPIYLYARPFSAPLASAFSVALFVHLWLSIRDGGDTRARWFVWGLAGGLAIVTSFFSAALLIVGAFEWGSRVFRPGGFVRALANAAAFLAGAAIVVVPALAIERQLDGGWLWEGHFPVFHWRHPQMLAAAFSLDHGAIVWTPILLLAVIGLLVAFGRQRVLGGALIVVSLLFFYLAASYGHATDEPRFARPELVALTACFVSGIAALIDATAGSRGRMAWAGASTVVALLIFWNFGLMLQWATGLVPSHGPVNFGQAAANQVAVVPRVAKEFVIRYVSEPKAPVSNADRGPR